MLTRQQFFGIAHSRLEEGFAPGDGEFTYYGQADSKPIRWTDAFRGYYVGKFNVKPSREFYQFVQAFQLSVDKK